MSSLNHQILCFKENSNSEAWSEMSGGCHVGWDLGPLVSQAQSLSLLIFSQILHLPTPALGLLTLLHTSHGCIIPP